MWQEWKSRQKDMTSCLPFRARLERETASKTGSPGNADFAFVENRLARGGADARHADCAHGQQAVEGPHAACRLHLDLRGRAAPHKFQILVGRASRAVAGRRLDEVGADLTANATELL